MLKIDRDNVRELKQDTCIQAFGEAKMCKEMGRELGEAVGVIRPPTFFPERRKTSEWGSPSPLFNTTDGKLLRCLLSKSHVSR